MYKVLILVGSSTIDGKGVFAIEKIQKGEIVWLYDKAKDISATQAEFEQFDDQKKAWFHHSAYLSPWTGLWICPPEGDASNYTNHSPDNNLSVMYDEKISPEPFFIANRDIDIGQEITNNYYEFDELTRKEKPKWAEEKT